MNTLYDLIAFGDKAFDAGEPLTHNWPQVRGAAALFGRVSGGLHQCSFASFERQFPERFDALSPKDQGGFPSPRAYNAARVQIMRTLVQIGAKTDPWEQLYGLIRKVDRADDITKALSGLKTPALAEGKAPADIRDHWVWSLPAAMEGGQRRMRIRRSVVVFDGLFEFSEIANSGLLPPARIGSPPAPDKYGRADLPPKLLSYQVEFENTSETRRQSALPLLWRAITEAGGLGLPDDPSAQDMLDAWHDIRALPASLIELSQASWQGVYLPARRALEPHATTRAAEVLPPYFEAMVKQSTDRTALKALWRQMLTAGVDEKLSAHDLLEIETWRSLWRNKPTNISASTIASHEIKSRKILDRNAPYQRDPFECVTRAWAHLPKAVRTDLAPIQTAAVKAYLRPVEVTPAWLDTLDLDATQRTQVANGLKAAAKPVEAPPAPLPSPTETAWQGLRKAAEAQGAGTFGIGPAETRAIQDNRSPTAIDRPWAIRISEGLPNQSQRAKFQMALRRLDKMIEEHPTLAHLLYGEAIGPLPDLRKRGAVTLPDDMAHELKARYSALGYSKSYCKEARGTVCKLLTKAAEQGLRIDTLAQALTQAEALAPETAKKARRIQENMIR